MTMLSFRVEDADATSVQAWADRLGLDRSGLLRDALRRHLVNLARAHDIEAWLLGPMTADERSLAAAADWGPAEDWSDWAYAAG